MSKFKPGDLVVWGTGRDLSHNEGDLYLVIKRSDRSKDDPLYVLDLLQVCDGVAIQNIREKERKHLPEGEDYGRWSGDVLRAVDYREMDSAPEECYKVLGNVFDLIPELFDELRNVL